MSDDSSKENLIDYGRAIVAVLEAFEVLYPKSRWVEKVLIKLLRMTYNARLDYLTQSLPPEVVAQFSSGHKSSNETFTE